MDISTPRARCNRIRRTRGWARIAGRTRPSIATKLYNLGHLYEAAVAHYQATGKRTLLDVAIKTADLLDSTFGPGKASIWPGHQITEMGLAKLYRVTGNSDYLNLAKFMLDVRGTNAKRRDNSYNQAQMPVTQQTEAVGHAVRATYMYSGMADVAALTGDSAYVTAIKNIWDNVAGKKLYVTGGIGARASGEAFGANYETLPNMTAYNETCAAVGNDYWNHRLFLLHADGKFIDVMERTLYNGLISGVSLDGKSFFYPNPLESNRQHSRSPWFGVACCPGNITRFMASVPGYVYAERGDAIWVNLYMASSAEIKMDNGRVMGIAQQTHYPWDGAIQMTLTPDKPQRATIHVRIPGWARNEAMPTDLYRFTSDSATRATVKVNGAPVAMKLDRGYVTLTRMWKRGDTIAVNLPMPVRRIVANDEVAADRGRVALERGPIVYAAEWPDNPGGKVRNLVLPESSQLTAKFEARAAERCGSGKVARDRLLARRRRQSASHSAGVHRDSLLCVGQSRTRADDGVARIERRERDARAISDNRQRVEGCRVECGQQVRRRDQRRRGAYRVESARIIL